MTKCEKLAHTTRDLMVKHLPEALLLALVVAAPAGAKPALWEEFRDIYLGRNRSDLMEYCSSGRKINQDGGYYFDPRTQRKKKELMTSRGLSIEMADAMLAGTAAAMAIACPEVR